MPRWCAIRILYMAAPCTTKWSIGWRADLRKTGAVVLRFNFRGVNLSEGEHAHGVGEMDDARAALDFLRALSRPSVDAGRVFLWIASGASVGLLLAAVAAAHSGRRVSDQGQDLRYLASAAVPKVFIQSTHDEHGPRLELEAVYPIREPKEIHWVEAKDHFFAGALDAFEQSVQTFAGLA